VASTVARQPICTPGRRLAFHCAPTAAASSTSVWGTDRYTDDSFVCMAAVHAGQIDPAKGGDVAIEIRRGLASYAGTTRNGVTTHSWAGWPCSFLFVGDRCDDDVMRCGDVCTSLANDERSCGACGHRCVDDDESCVAGRCEPVLTDWSATAAAYPCDVGAKHVLGCPAAGTLGRTIWGTDVYTNDSPICVAAVHAGKIAIVSGGRVVVKIVAGQSSYSGSTRNGVTSTSYGPWTCSFQFD
jgi:hypothetical protein